MIYILGDPGAVSGGREKSKQARKKFGRRKVKKEGKSPWGQGFLTDQFQTVGAICQSSCVLQLPAELIPTVNEAVTRCEERGGSLACDATFGTDPSVIKRGLI